MRFTVTWNPIAEGQLLDLWADFPEDREGLTGAIREIDRVLRDDPLSKGRPFGVSRILIWPPVVVLHSVDEADRKVKILLVKRL